jgi:hypothetical protein
MAVITLNEIKLLLGIADTSKDALITALIPMVEADIIEYTNRQWTDGPDEPIWPIWMKPAAARMINWLMSAQSFNGLTSESIGTYSYTKAQDVGGYPIGLWAPFDKVKMARMGSGQKRGQFRDARGLDIYDLQRDRIENTDPNKVMT